MLRYSIHEKKKILRILASPNCIACCRSISSENNPKLPWLTTWRKEGSSKTPEISSWSRKVNRVRSRHFSCVLSGDSSRLFSRRPPKQYRTQSQRTVSTSAPENPTAQDLLDQTKYPLGTLKWKDWDNGMASFARLIGAVPTSHDDESDWKGLGTSLLTADKVLQRLIQEAATKSIVSQQFLGTTDILDSNIALLQAWLALNRTYPSSPVVLTFGQSRFRGAVSEYHRLMLRDLTHSNNGKVEEHIGALRKALIDLVDSWRQLETLEGLDHAVDLLCSEEATRLLKDYHPPSIVSIYHDALQQCMIISEAENSAAKLLNFMEQRAKARPGWENIRPSDDEIQSALGFQSNRHNETTQLPENRSDMLDHMESQAYFQRILNKLKQAKRRDDETVQEATALLESLGTRESRAILTLALADYSVATNDVANATAWLTRLSTDDAAGITEQVVELLSKCIVLWLQKGTTDPSAVFRAEETLFSLEAIAGVASVDNRLYLALAKSWLQSKELGSIRKASSVALRAASPSHELLLFALKCMSRGDQDNSKDLVLRAYHWYERLLDTVDDEQRLELVNALIPVLVKANCQAETIKVVVSTMNCGLSASPESLGALVSSLQHAPVERFQLVHDLIYSSSSAPLNLPTALAIISNLHPDPNESHLQIIQMLLKPDVVSIEKDSDYYALFEQAIESLLEWNQFTNAVELVEITEQTFPQNKQMNELVTSCYQKVIISLARNRRGNFASNLFRKIRSDPTKSQACDSDFCWKYMASLSETDRLWVVHNRQWIVNECREVLTWLVQIFRSSNNKEYKPKASMYSEILGLLYFTLHKSSKGPKIAIELVNEMLDLSAHEKSTEPFHKAMQIALKARTTRRFEDVYALYNKMADVDVEVDTTALHKLLWACMSIRNKHAASTQLETALQEFRKARQNGILTEESFSILFKAIDCLGDKKSKFALAQRILEMCSAEGFLSTAIQEEAGKILPEQIPDTSSGPMNNDGRPGHNDVQAV